MEAHFVQSTFFSLSFKPGFEQYLKIKRAVTELFFYVFVLFSSYVGCHREYVISNPLQSSEFSGKLRSQPVMLFSNIEVARDG